MKGERALRPTARLMGIEEYSLPNGLRVVLAPDQAKPTFTINLTVLVGSIHEGAGEAGMAHVFEHLLFRGLEGFPDVKETFNALGSRCNGTTWFDRTNFFATLSSSDENLETAIRLEAARLGRATLREEDLLKEGKIVESEFEMRATFPQSLMMRGMLGCMFDFHAYSREPIGTIEDFKSLRMEGIKAFYKRYYTPDNAVLFIAGKFDPAKALALAAEHFKGLKKSRQGRPVYTTREPGAQGERRYVVRGAGDAFQVMAGYRVPGASTPDAAVADALAMALVLDRIGPLHDAIVGKGLASSVGVFPMDLRMPSPLIAMAEVPRDKDVDVAERALVEAVERGAASLAQADLDRAKSSIERYRDQIFNDPEALADKLSQFEAGGSWKLMIVRCEQAKALTLEDVKTFAARYVRRENRVVGRFEPDPSAVAVLPDRERGIGDYADLLAKVPADVKSTKEFSYTPASLQKALLWVDVGPARIGLIPKEVKGDDVFITLRIPFAGRAAVAGSYCAGSALGTLMTKRTRALTKEELERTLADANSNVGASVMREGAVFGVKTKLDRLESVLSLAWETLRTPFVQEQEVRDHVARKAGDLKALQDNPQLVLGMEINRMLFPEGDPRRSRAADEQIADLERLTPDSILAFHRDFFGADGLVGAVVGDLSPNDVVRLFAPLVAEGWRAGIPPVDEPNMAVKGVTAAEARFPTPGKPSAFNAIVHPLAVSQKSPDSIPMEAVAWMLFQDPLASRIPRKIREEAALSYAVQGQYVAELDGDFSYAMVLTVTTPANARRSVDLALAEIEGALKDGFTAGEVDAFKKSHRNRLMVARSDDNMVGAMVAELGRNRLDFGLWARQDEELEALTAERVNDAFRRHYQPSKIGLIQIGDLEECRA